MHRPTTAAVCLAALLGALSACSSPDAGGAASAHPPGRRLVVGLYDSKGPIRLDLANATHPELADVYSHQRKDAALKLAPDELMDQLLNDLAQLSFPDLSASGDPPPEGPAVRGWVCVDEGGARRTFVVPAEGASREQLEKFVGMKLVINEYYTKQGALQFVNNPQGKAIFRGKQQ